VERREVRAGAALSFFFFFFFFSPSLSLSLFLSLSPNLIIFSLHPLLRPTPASSFSLSQHTRSILYVRNLPFNISVDTLYSTFGKYGPLRQVRLGNAPNTRGTAFVVYEDIFDAAAAAAGLSGFNVGNRYLVVLFHSASRAAKRAGAAADADALRALQAEHGVDGVQR
jgi:pre-mRNA branch site protein p14